MNFLIKPKKNGNILATIVIGKKFYNNWFKFSYPSWKLYCKKNQLGLVCFKTDIISKKDPKWKKATWQKLLIADKLKQSNFKINNVCYLDSDILINYMNSPNIFDFYKENKIGLVSEIFNLPYELSVVKKLLSFYRNFYYDKKYPLNSSIFMTPKEIFDYHKLKKFNNYACMGLILFNIKNHSNIMKNIFFKYNKNIKTITGGGDETILNYEFQKLNKIQWFEYKFQALWIYEIAWKYDFLYNFGKKNKKLITKCIETSLKHNYFLHFAGSWFESEMWKIPKIFSNSDNKNELKKLSSYLKNDVKPLPRKKQIKPSKKLI